MQTDKSAPSLSLQFIMPCHEKSSLRKAVLYQQLLLINKLVTKIMKDSDSEISSYILSSDTEHISVPNVDSISIKEQLKMCCKPTYRIRRVKSRGAILILVWNFLVISILWYLGKNHYNRGFIRNNNGSIFVGLAFLAVAVPLAGWLADACIGRYRMIYCSVLIMWGAAILETVSSVADSLSAGYYFAKSVIKQVLLALMGIGMGGFLSTVVQFGIDQLRDASTEEISAYIMWYAWTFTFPPFVISISYKYLPLNHQQFVPLGNLFICLTLSFVLVSLFCWNNLLIKEPISQNPFKLIYKVSKYALKHRYLTSRSAFTYAKEEAIGRIDFGKSKYGGPFTTEQVEDHWCCVIMCCIAHSISAKVDINHLGHRSN